MGAFERHCTFEVLRRGSCNWSLNVGTAIGFIRLSPALDRRGLGRLILDGVINKWTSVDPNLALVGKSINKYSLQGSIQFDTSFIDCLIMMIGMLGYNIQRLLLNSLSPHQHQRETDKRDPLQLRRRKWILRELTL